MNTILVKKNTIGIIVLTFVVGISLGVVAHRFSGGCRTNDFRYINPDFACDDKAVVKKNSYVVLRHDIERFIEIQKKEHGVTDVSVYFRDLQNGPTLGINEHALFSPASLLKLPLLLTFYNLESQTEGGVLDTKITITSVPQPFVQVIPPKEYAKNGETYSVEQLLEYMIKYSDNNSYYTLLAFLRQTYPNRDVLKETFVDLGIIDPKDALDNTISVKSYSSIFVQLYNSSYFSKKEVSEEALALLSQASYTEGLRAGVPDSIDIAHKFGERTNIPGGLDQLHDCGIVYYPGNPYLLCVMTRGPDFTKLPTVIETISRMVYDEFDSRKL